MKNIKSPVEFIDTGFYAMVGACLQRRVWLGPPEAAIFPNIYVLLVGPPGVGKGLVLKQVNELLKWHKKTQGTLEAAQNIQELKRKAQSDGNIDPAVVVQLAQAEQAMRDIADSGGASKEKSKQNFLFPVAPESITYEALVSLNARLSSTVKGISPQSMAPSGIYIHHSLCFILEEMSSLFRKSRQLFAYLL
jgi:hypothetical protein